MTENGLGTFAQGMRDMAAALRKLAQRLRERAEPELPTCDYCSEPSDDLQPVGDNDVDNGYYDTMMLCPTCRAKLDNPDPHDFEVELDIMREDEHES